MTRSSLFVALSLTLGTGGGALAQGVAPEPPGDQARERGWAPWLSLARNASGTAWQPPSAPVHGHHTALDAWTLMLHYSAFAGYDHQSTDRGDGQFLSTNWIMAMAQRDIGEGQIAARVMLSAEPLTVGKSGYPLLFQTGEATGDKPNLDRQHPHDLFMELALLAAHPLGQGLALQLYVAPVGEPALGPVAFPHRVSARGIALAPLGHHWQDATHISFGVVTVGFETERAKLEGSWFNGREPDEDRYGIDLDVPDSYALRLQATPLDELHAQLSYGYLASPEALHPDQQIHRVTASVTHSVPLFRRGHVSTTVLWGRNINARAQVTDAFLAESNLDFDGSSAIFGRAELVDKTAGDLGLPGLPLDKVFRTGPLTLGYAFRPGLGLPFTPEVGALGTIDLVSAELGRFYGQRLPWGAMVFVGVAPPVLPAHEGH